MPIRNLLIISNGHGEDSIAAEIVRRLPETIEIAAYPTLGDGRAYDGVCPIVGPRRHLPSEGHRQKGSLRRDARAGFGIAQALRFMRGEARLYDAIIVVGDMLGVVMCWLGRCRVRIYVDVYKTGYANRYSALERWIIGRSCDLVLTRDDILAGQLAATGINARCAGNVMMDTLVAGDYDATSVRQHGRAIAILPGSRASAPANFALQAAALRRVPGIADIDLFGALPKGSDPAVLAKAAGLSWTPTDGAAGGLGTLTGDLTVHLSSGSLGAVLAAADLVLGQGGTANMQALGLGKPVVSFLAENATDSRRKRNAVLTGDSRIVTERTAEALAAALVRLLSDDADRLRRGAIGRERIGPPGAIRAIIAELSR
ncbi:MAG: hypothetical protein HY834_03475 [Devosia nanyangense]|uniref:Uncharacterized protein n=1 Tax=Devosia nanyangense TaxID=1228055 RepID=A0A933KY70_9HYPH|nr:hypothetical protein [Devosia nanyangense]